MPSFDKAIILALAPLGASGYRPPQKDSSSAVTPDAAGKMNKLARSEVAAPGSGDNRGRGFDAEIGEGLDTNGVVTHSLAELSQGNFTSTEGLDTDVMITDSLAELSKGNHTSDEGLDSNSMITHNLAELSKGSRTSTQVTSPGCNQEDYMCVPTPGCGYNHEENKCQLCTDMSDNETKCLLARGCGWHDEPAPPIWQHCKDVKTWCRSLSDVGNCNVSSGCYWPSECRKCNVFTTCKPK